MKLFGLNKKQLIQLLKLKKLQRKTDYDFLNDDTRFDIRRILQGIEN